MSQVHFLQFEALETRELLSSAHHAAHAAGTHSRPTVAMVPLVIDGSVAVNNNAAVSDENLDGGTTTSIPLTGQLGALGKVTGVWYESTDEYGDYLGPDTITFHDAQGSFTVAFNNGTSGPAHRTGPHSVYFEHPLEIKGGSVAYAGDTGSGTIDLNMNAAHTEVASITINAQSKSK
jgi:hypothetical protein